MRITGDPDLDTVLQGVVDGARSLTGAGLGGITTPDRSGGFEGFITSGLSAEEHRLVLELPGGMEFFTYLGQLALPLGPVCSFLQTPIRLRSQQLGTIYLSEKTGGGEFSHEDEETLALFAA